MRLNELVLDFFYEKKGKYIPASKIASDLDISEPELIEIIQSLEDQEYKIAFSEGQGYKIEETPNLLLPYEIKRNLNTDFIGKKIYYYQEVDSTNELAKELAENGAEDGTLIIAQTQRRGKGRHGKKWISPSGGIWMTIILRPTISPEKAPLLTLVTGVAVAETIKEQTGLDVKIKWPNDILIDEKKVCGILTEAHARYNTLDYVIIGIGIDANVDIELFPQELRNGATSIKQELEREISYVELVQRFLEKFEDFYFEFNEDKFPEILRKWRKYSKTIGSYVEVHKKLGKVVRGEAVGINKKGALILELDDGTLRKVFSGECIHLN
ncbi:MAG: biotin--[acetyl-CoA-carboxylase] ligase [Methanobacteriaceae archaeon]|nr:biotin--[acetyl-CoA-carboxylase] ligase [Methanobacteriaceae archaeon]